MNQVHAKVRDAKRRMVLGLFGRIFCRLLGIAALVATIGVTIPVVWNPGIDRWSWLTAWTGTSLLAATFVSIVVTWYFSPATNQVALEVDRRFNLRERVSSSLTLPVQEQQSAAGTALLEDAEKRATQIQVADEFGLRPNRLAWWPCSMLVLLTCVSAFVTPELASSAVQQSAEDDAASQQIKRVASTLKKKIQQQKRNADAQGLKEARDLYEKMEAKLDKVLASSSVDRKEAMITINDLKKQIEERREKLASPSALQRALSQMEGLESGAGDKIAKSIEKGDFQKANELVNELAQKMNDGSISESDKQMLQKQLQAMSDALQAAQEQHAKQKSELQRQIEEARSEGRGERMADLQKQLNELSAKDSQMKSLGEMAEAMNAASESLRTGDLAEASEALEAMSDNLNQMQQEMSELEDLESAIGQISQSKNQMRCEQCEGSGCSQCQGNQLSDKGSLGKSQSSDGQGRGDGMGQGQGFGDRPESESDTNTYESQVKGEVKPGRAVIAGYADGPNRKGVSREDLKQAIEQSLRQDANPSENQVLPKAEREHAMQYFNQMREDD